MIEIENPEINVEDLMRSIREEVAKRKAKLSNAKTPVSNLTTLGSTAIASDIPYAQANIMLNRIPEKKGCIADKSEYRVTDFFDYHDGDFIRSAYSAILHREPDTVSYDNYLKLLYAGHISKVEILGRLRYSAEGKACAVPIHSLRRPYLLETTYRIPVLGPIVEFIRTFIRLPAVIRNQVNIQNYNLRQQREQVVQINALASQIESAIRQIQQRMNCQEQLLVTKVDSTQTDEKLSGLIQALGAKADAVQTDEKLSGLIQALGAKADAASIQQDTQDIKRQILDHKYNILDQQRRLALFLEEARKRLPEPISIEQIKNMVAEEDHLLDAFYISFEDQFRGTRNDIKQRASEYLPIVQAAKAGTNKAPILDIGCGRGEWLELLLENDLLAQGVDLNSIMVSQCHDLGLDVTAADAIDYLRNLKANSLGAVTGMHIIEHIPFKRLIALFDEVLRVLKPGGVAIFETPNPENLIVGACNFYYDPTHLNPLPPEPMRFVMEARGFGSIEILRLHPCEESSMLKDGSEHLQQIVNGLLFGAQDYALVAYKN